MAAPINNRSKPGSLLYEKTRAKIKVSQLVNRLNANALGTLTNPPGRKLEEGEVLPIIEMTTGQIRSAEILLNKSLPSLQATELTGPGGKDLFNDMTGDDLNARIKELESKSKD